MKVEQKGMKRLAYLTDYNAIRLHSITDQEAFNEPDVLGDRLSLATKDRNIRMIYFNIGVKKDFTKAEIVNSIDNMLHSLKERVMPLLRLKPMDIRWGRRKRSMSSTRHGSVTRSCWFLSAESR